MMGAPPARLQGILRRAPAGRTAIATLAACGSSLAPRSHGSPWRYSFSEATSHDTSLLTRIGTWVARWFGFRSYGSPVDVEYRNEVRHQLTLYFDPDGTVDDYSYGRSEHPSHRVYRPVRGAFALASGGWERSRSCARCC